MSKIRDYLRLMRVRHYIKNALVFAALVFSGQFFQVEKLRVCLTGFLAFSALSSCVYILNDIRDRAADRAHPSKRTRPIASGRVSVPHAAGLAFALASLAGLLNATVFQWRSSLVLCLYLLTNLGYSFGLKDIPLVDVTALMSGFLLRLLYGALIADISLSSWLYLTVMALSFYLALGKRRNEMKRVNNENTRKVLQFYSVEFLDKNMYMCLTLANVFYALWSRNVQNSPLHYTVPVVLLITMKYSLDIEGDSDGDPVNVLLGDKVLLGLCVAYMAMMFFLLYF